MDQEKIGEKDKGSGLPNARGWYLQSVGVSEGRRWPSVGHLNTYNFLKIFNLTYEWLLRPIGVPTDRRRDSWEEFRHSIPRVFARPYLQVARMTHSLMHEPSEVAHRLHLQGSP